MMELATNLFYLLVFPGFLFLVSTGLFVEFLDRKLYARVQNRRGPPPLQPLADVIKLLSKESIVPENAQERVYSAAPLFGLAGVLTAVLYVPIWTDAGVFSFQGDLVVVLFLLSLPSFALIFGGWYSRNLFSQVGTTRTVTQLFGYEIPFFLACLAPAVAAGTWELSGVLRFLGRHPRYLPLLVPGFAVALLSLEAKLERIPFDIPEAETEIATGSLAEYSGRKLALFRLTKDVEMVVGAALLVALFLGGPYPLASPGLLGGLLGFVAFAAKALLVVFLLTMVKSLFARLRIEQMVTVFYKWLVPVAIAQVLLVVAAGLGGVV